MIWAVLTSDQALFSALPALLLGRGEAAADTIRSKMMEESAAAAVNPNDRVGLILVVGSAVGLGLAMAVSRFAYDDGANGLALGTSRALFFVPALFFSVS